MISEAAIAALSGSIARALCSRYLNTEADDAAAPLLDLVGRRVTDALRKRRLAATFDTIGIEVVGALQPVFADADPAHLAVDAVALALAGTITRELSQQLLAASDLDPEAVGDALLASSPPDAVGFSADETALYHRAVRETARAAVQAAHALPGFDHAVTERSLARSSELLDLVREALESLARLHQRVATLTPDPDDADFVRYEVDYRNALQRSLDKVELFGVSNLRPEAREQALSVAYVSLDADLGHGSQTLSGAELVQSAADGSGRLLVRGTAGSGKTTLFRWIALQAARMRVGEGAAHIQPLRGLTSYSTPDESPQSRRLKRIALAMSNWPPIGLPAMSAVSDPGPPDLSRYLAVPAWAHQIPFFLRLRDCQNGRLPRPADFPDFAARTAGEVPTRWVESVLRDGRAIVLLDGVDEIPGHDRRRLRQDVQDIVQAYPDNLFLVSTRPEAVGPDWLASLGFAEARVNPLTPTGRTELVRNWHRAVGGQLPDPTDEQLDELKTTGEHLVAQLRESPRIARLATNPLLCAMVCALHLERHQHLPKSARDLCNAACEMLLHRRELESDIDTGRFSPGYSALDYEQKRGIVQSLAHYMVRNEASAVGEPDAVLEVAHSLQGYPTVTSADPAEVLEGLVERSGVLRRDKPGSIEFVHNTLKEYLAAERYVHDRDAGALAAKFDDPTFEPVLLFACAERDPTFATRLIQAVLDGDGAQHERQLFAVRARAVALHLDPALSETIESFEKTLFPPQTMSDAEALAELGEAVIPYLRYRSSYNSRPAAACIRALGLIGTEAAIDAVRGYLVNLTRAVRTELLRTLDPLEVPWFRSQFLGKGGDMKSSEQRELGQAYRRITDLSLIDPEDWSGVKSLTLSRTSVRDLSPLRHAQSMRALDLSMSVVRSLDPLRDVHTLEVLDVSACSNLDLSPLGQLPSLRALNVGDTPDSLRPLWQPDLFQSLHTLVATGSLPTEGSPPPLVNVLTRPATARDWSTLASLDTLETLQVGGCKVSSEHLSVLLGSKSDTLRHLDIRFSDVEPDAFDLSAPRLKTLTLRQCASASPIRFGDFRGLKALGLGITPLPHLDALRGLDALEVLDVQDASVEDYGPLRSLPMLKEIAADSNFHGLLSALPGMSLCGLLWDPWRAGHSLSDHHVKVLTQHGLPPQKRAAVFGTLDRYLDRHEPFARLGWYTFPHISQLKPF